MLIPASSNASFTFAHLRLSAHRAQTFTLHVTPRAATLHAAMLAATNNGALEWQTKDLNDSYDLERWKLAI